MFRRKKLIPEVVPDRKFIALVDLYSKGRSLRGGIDIVLESDPIYIDSQWAFKEVE